MPLTQLNCVGVPVSDLSPLKGMPLTALVCYGTQVSDLSPVEGMKLERLVFTPQTITQGIEIVRNMKSIKSIGLAWDKCTSPAEFWKKYDAGEFK